MSNVVFLLDILMPEGMPPPVIEVQNGQRRVLTKWGLDPIYRQHRYSTDQEVRGRVPLQLNTFYPHMERLANYWGTPIEQCETMLPHSLLMVHFNNRHIAPKNFLRIIACPEFISSEGPYTPEERTFD